MKEKRVPLRMCEGCGAMKPKKELMRVVKTPDTTDENGNTVPGVIALDITASGRMNGRGAYICPDPACLQAAAKARKLERRFSCKIEQEIYDALEEELRKV